MGTYNIALLPGDCIGPEVVGETVKVLKKVGDKFWDLSRNKKLVKCIEFKLYFKYRLTSVF